MCSCALYKLSVSVSASSHYTPPLFLFVKCHTVQCTPFPFSYRLVTGLHWDSVTLDCSISLSCFPVMVRMGGTLKHLVLRPGVSWVVIRQIRPISHVFMSRRLDFLRRRGRVGLYCRRFVLLSKWDCCLLIIPPRTNKS
jgi:hypothetical protein